MASRLFLLLAAVHILVACAPPATPAKTTSGLEPYRRSDLGVRADEAFLTFTTPLKGVNSREHYILAVRFLADEGRVTLHSHFNGFSYRDGFRVSVHKKDGLWLEAAAPGYPGHIVQLPADWLQSDGRLKIRIEVHDGVSVGSRVLVWGYYQSLQGEILRPLPWINAGNATVDSREEKWIFPTHGRGALWGLETQNVLIEEAFREAPYVP